MPWLTSYYKVIILGDSGVGKTSLMNQYVRWPYPDILQSDLPRPTFGMLRDGGTFEKLYY